jgi:hypothetical protein
VVEGADQIEQLIAHHRVSIGVIATPAGAAQGVCDRLVAAGVTSILNFAPVVLTVPVGVDVRKVDLSIELQILPSTRNGGLSCASPRMGSVTTRAGLCQLMQSQRSERGHDRRIGGRGAMSVLIVGLSHKSAPVAMLERAAVSGRPAQQAAA